MAQSYLTHLISGLTGGATALLRGKQQGREAVAAEEEAQQQALYRQKQMEAMTASMLDAEERRRLDRESRALDREKWGTESAYWRARTKGEEESARRTGAEADYLRNYGARPTVPSQRLNAGDGVTDAEGRRQARLGFEGQLRTAMRGHPMNALRVAPGDAPLAWGEGGGSRWTPELVREYIDRNAPPGLYSEAEIAALVRAMEGRMPAGLGGRSLAELMYQFGDPLSRAVPAPASEAPLRSDTGRAVFPGRRP